MSLRFSRVAKGVNISIEYAFRNHDKAQFLEGAIWGHGHLVLTTCDCDNNEGKREAQEKSVRGRRNVELPTSCGGLRHPLMDISIRKPSFCEKVTETIYSRGSAR